MKLANYKMKLLLLISTDLIVILFFFLKHDRDGLGRLSTTHTQNRSRDVPKKNQEPNHMSYLLGSNNRP